MDKILCVGMRKTGTTSLADALRVLGYRTQESLPPSDISPFNEVDMRLFDAFLDEPWCYLYRSFALAFPGSRFILTLREPNEWLTSYMNMFPEADPANMLITYTDHVANARKHLAGDRLLEFSVMDGWEPLCEFLDRPVPAIPFPWAEKRGAGVRIKWQ